MSMFRKLTPDEAAATTFEAPKETSEAASAVAELTAAFGELSKGDAVVVDVVGTMRQMKRRVTEAAKAVGLKPQYVKAEVASAAGFADNQLIFKLRKPVQHRVKTAS